MAREIKAFPFEMKLNENKRTVEGYASTFGNKDLVGDIVTPGAFKKTIMERMGKIKLLWQHYDPLGKPLRIEEDSKGLQVEAYISKTQLGNDALELVKDGVIDAFSIGYDVINDEYDPSEQTRYLKELRLHEFSLVTFPANPEAGVSGVKSYSQFTEILQKTARLNASRLGFDKKALGEEEQALITTAINALNEILTLGEPEPDDDDKNGKSIQTGNRIIKPHLSQVDLKGITPEILKQIADNYKIKL